MATLFFVALIVLVLIPGKKEVRTNLPLLVALILIELFYLYQFIRRKRRKETSRTPSDIVTVVWTVFMIWELCTTIFNIAHPILVPTPEGVFHVFATSYGELLLNVAYSMEILFIGFFSGLIAGVILGVTVGWVPRLRNFCFPVASVLAPIPPVVFSPYLVSILPTFRSASVVVIVLGVFWPTFLNMIIRVNSIDPRIMDSARALNVKDSTMVWKVILPYVFPSVISGLRVSMTTSLLMLNFAEMIGATHGMGYYIQNNNVFANYTNLIAGIFVEGIVVTSLIALISWVQRKAVKWH
ncbi:MAG: ABC transporter permease [Oscillospiraceae bacterium]|nr:ABC transporter permease [Oscillospiraceae bacterium]